MSLKNVLPFLALLPFTAQAEGVPNWVTKPPAEDAENRYYVGRGAGISEAEAVSLCIEDARTQAVRDNFGISTKFQAQSYETLESKSLVSRTDEASFAVLIKGFKQVDLYQSNREYWALFSYSKSAIAEERKRLAALPKEAAPKVTVVEGKKHKGGVEVITDPENAAVSIDGVSFATTPVKIVGRLEAGEHTIRIELPGYKVIEEQLIVAPGVTAKFRKFLVREPDSAEQIEKPQPEQRNRREEMEEKYKEQFYNTENPRPDLS